MRPFLVAVALSALPLAGFGGELPLGSKLAAVTVSDNATPVSVALTGAPSTVVIFVSTKCPISNSYNERMNAIFREYAGKNVRFAFVNANSNEPPAEIEEHARANQFAFKVYKDVNGALADQFGATVTPEAYVFDREGVLQYHGYVDDASNEARVRVRGLRSALDSVLAGKPVEVKQTKAFGCTIKRARKTT